MQGWRCLLLGQQRHSSFPMTGFMSSSGEHWQIYLGGLPMHKTCSGNSTPNSGTAWVVPCWHPHQPYSPYESTMSQPKCPVCGEPIYTIRRGKVRTKTPHCKATTQD